VAVIEMRLADLSATIALGRRLAARLQVGDTVLLTGDLGAGKTELARAIIRARAGQAIDVPSPTFNLVIPYVLRDMTISHFDLYRLDGPDDIPELGLDEALDEGAIIVEWPDRLGDLVPPDAISLCLTLDAGGDTDSAVRQVAISGPPEILERLLGT